MSFEERERLVDLKIAVPLSTYRLLQSAADEYRVPASVMAAHQLIKHNDPGLRKRQMLQVRARVFVHWRNGLSSPKIARELGVSRGTVDKHKRAIRSEWNQWAESIPEAS
jgi:DNA-binding NarL/FixJ family response regulator